MPSIRAFGFVTAVIIMLSPMAAPAAVVVAATPAPVKCAIPRPCATFTNTSSGPGIEVVGSSGEAGLGVSSGGAGLIGLSGSGNFMDAGVDGESYDASGNDAGGVFGADFFANGVAPTYGAVGVGAPYGLLGLGALPGTSSSYSYGVLGQDDYGSATGGDYNVGVGGQSVAGIGVLGESNASPAYNVGAQPIGVFGVADVDSNAPDRTAAYGLVGESNSISLALANSTSSATAQVLSSSDFFFFNKNGGGQMEADVNGNETISGTLTTKKGVYARTTGASGTAMIEYGMRETAPHVEDVGEAQLADGRAYVTIDPRLGDTIDRRTSYHVFVTPEGDCNGLFVTQKTAAGFAVRELRGGRSSLAFEYRIVAKPLDENGARLAIAPPLTKPLDDGLEAGRYAHRLSPPLSPLQRLKQRIGTQAYAEAMLEFRAKRQAMDR